MQRCAHPSRMGADRCALSRGLPVGHYAQKYSRTDPYNNTLDQDRRQSEGIYPHQMYELGKPDHDIALRGLSRSSPQTPCRVSRSPAFSLVR
jgi:hypothetical protein